MKIVNRCYVALYVHHEIHLNAHTLFHRSVDWSVTQLGQLVSFPTQSTGRQPDSVARSVPQLSFPTQKICRKQGLQLRQLTTYYANAGSPPTGPKRRRSKCVSDYLL